MLNNDSLKKGLQNLKIIFLMNAMLRLSKNQLDYKVFWNHFIDANCIFSRLRTTSMRGRIIPLKYNDSGQDL